MLKRAATPSHFGLMDVHHQFCFCQLGLMHFLGLTFNYKECQPKTRTYCGGGAEWPFLFNIVQKL